MHFYDIEEVVHYYVNGKFYPASVYIKAYDAANCDPALRAAISKAEDDCLQKWCEYFEAQEKELQQICND